MVFTSKLSNEIFENYPESSDEVIIVSGYVSPAEVEKILKTPLKTKILLGMATQGISKYYHKKFIELNKNSNLNLFYALPQNEVHSKCYIWKKENQILRVLVGSANFTHPGLNSPNREILIDMTSDLFIDFEKYLNIILDNAKKEECDNSDLVTNIKPHRKSKKKGFDPDKLLIKIDTIRLSLLTRNGKVPDSSGLNWGHGIGHVKPNDSYIKIPKDALRTSFFQPKSTKQTAIDAIWDDGTAMELYEEGNQNYNKLLYPKQIASAKSKEILGKYFRKRMNVSSGKKIKLSDLKRYGRTYIDITKLEDNSYYLDFKP